MSDANFEVCLLTSPVRDVLEELRVLLGPLRGLHYKMLDSIEANYSDSADALLLRLRFSKGVKATSLQKQLVHHLGGLGLHLILPQNLSPFEREKFDEQLAEEYNFATRGYPTARTPSVLPMIFEALEAHLVSARQPRSHTIEALDLIISELDRPGTLAEGSNDSMDVVSGETLRQSTAEVIEARMAQWPIRADTFGALDEMISSLPARSTTIEALDDFIDELRGPA